MNPVDFSRLMNNFYASKGIEVDANRISTDAELVNYFFSHQKDLENKYKIAFVFICLNPLYWQYAPEMVAGAKQFFLPSHKTDFFFWTDIPEKDEDVATQYKDQFIKMGIDATNPSMVEQNILINNKYIFNIQSVINNICNLKKTEGIHIISTERVEWPYPTLLRYNLFLQEEEKLKEYDYIFYCDIDMKFVNIVGDEILGDGITAALHPGYAINPKYIPPWETNENSASYIKIPGKTVIDENTHTATQEHVGKRFVPYYYAGGFQGGKSDKFIQAMKDTKMLIEKDLAINYIPRWNDESAWNKYLSINTPEIVLSPSYIYPDSLIKEYYEPLWGRSYQPKLITITKWFSLSKEGGEALQKMIQK